MNVHPVTSTDLAAMAYIVNWAIEHTPAHFGVVPITENELRRKWEHNRDTYPWFAAEVDDGVVGFAYGSPYKPREAYRWTVDVSVYVHPDHHGCGLGRALYAALIDELRKRGLRSAFAAIALPNPASVRLHESFGFTHIGTLRRAGWKLGKWHDVGHWQLMFSESNDAPDPIGDGSRT